VGVRASDVAEQGQLGAAGGGPGDGQRDTQNRVGAEARLVAGAVEVDEELVDDTLLVGL
jgi:hypothetical protein